MIPTENPKVLVVSCNKLSSKSDAPRKSIIGARRSTVGAHSSPQWKENRTPKEWLLYIKTIIMCILMKVLWL